MGSGRALCIVELFEILLQSSGQIRLGEITEIASTSNSKSEVSYKQFGVDFGIDQIWISLAFTIYITQP